MTSQEELLALFAERSLVLAGFVGAVSAFSGRERTFETIDLVRLHHVLGCAAAILAGCLAFYTARSAELSIEASLATAGVISLLVALVTKTPGFRTT